MDVLPQSWVRPSDPGYEAARRIYNAAHPAYPALVARVAGVADIRQALSRARAERRPVAVRGGGHSIAGLGTVDGGIVIDLRDLQSVELGPETGEVWVGGGTPAGVAASRLAEVGLVLPLGDSPTVGIGGITLGGGVGWLTRRFGLTLDSLVAIELVCADGKVVRIDAGAPELFWALRGGGGGFGVATRLCFRPYRLDSVLGGTLVLPLTARSLAGVVEVAWQAPDDLGIIALATRPLEDDGAPPVLVLTLVWSGAVLEGERVLKGLRGVATPLRDDIRATRYDEMYRLADGAPLTVTNTTESLFADALDEKAIAAILEAVAVPAPTGVLAAIELRVLGGAMARFPSAATAFAHRERRLLISAVRAGFPAAQYAQHRAWVVAVADALRLIKRGTYLNFVENLAATDPADVFPTATRGRLATVKAALDPEDIFTRHIRFSD